MKIATKLAMAILLALCSARVHAAGGNPTPPSHGCSWIAPEFHDAEIAETGNPPTVCQNWYDTVDGSLQTSSGYCTEASKGPSGSVLWQVNMVVGDTGADITGIASCMGNRYSYVIPHCPKAANGMEPSAGGGYNGAGCNWFGTDGHVHANFCNCSGTNLLCGSN
jgi:hypothetical protein